VIGLHGEDDDIDGADVRGSIGDFHVVQIGGVPSHIALDVQAVALNVCVTLAAGNEGHVESSVH
jgi:hypothetical protein